jgi:hypothetical protein
VLQVERSPGTVRRDDGVTDRRRWISRSPLRPHSRTPAARSRSWIRAWPCRAGPAPAGQRRRIGRRSERSWRRSRARRRRRRRPWPRADRDQQVPPLDAAHSPLVQQPVRPREPAAALGVSPRSGSRNASQDPHRAAPATSPTCSRSRCARPHSSSPSSSLPVRYAAAASRSRSSGPSGDSWSRQSAGRTRPSRPARRTTPVPDRVGRSCSFDLPPTVRVQNGAAEQPRQHRAHPSRCWRVKPLLNLATCS